MWDLRPPPGMEPQLAALKGEVLTPGPPGKSLTSTFKDSFNNRKTNRISHVTVASTQYKRGDHWLCEACFLCPLIYNYGHVWFPRLKAGIPLVPKVLDLNLVLNWERWNLQMWKEKSWIELLTESIENNVSTTRVCRLWCTGYIWSLPVFINTFYWNTARLIHLCFVYGCLHAKVAELKSWNGDQLVHKT